MNITTVVTIKNIVVTVREVEFECISFVLLKLRGEFSKMLHMANMQLSESALKDFFTSCYAC